MQNKTNPLKKIDEFNEKENNIPLLTEGSEETMKELPQIHRPDSILTQNINFIQSKIEKEKFKRESIKHANHIL